MNPHIRPSLIPRCLSCARSYIEAGTAGWKPLFGTGGQTRNITKDKSIAVQLLKPLPGYGKPGKYVPVSRGKMRNLWFPSKIARYAVGEELIAIKAGRIEVQRNVEFGFGKSPEERKLERDLKEASKVVEEQEPTQAKATHLDSGRAMDLLGVLLPARIDFIRAVHAESPDATEDSIPIYGSVSTTDIVQEIRNLLAHNDEAARITLDESDIKFVDIELEDPTRAKHLGVFPIEVLVKGSDQWPVSRKVHVIAQGER